MSADRPMVFRIKSVFGDGVSFCFGEAEKAAMMAAAAHSSQSTANLELRGGLGC